MTSVNVTGVLTDSAGVAIDATITVNLERFRTDSDTAFLPIAYSFTVTGGVIDFNIPNSETSYKWDIISGGENVLSFFAGVPDQASINFADLLPLNYSINTIDTSLIRLADFLVNDPARLAKIAPNFDGKGTYNPATTYFLNDTVDYLGSSYYWKLSSPGAGHLPTDDTYWQLIAEKGDTGAGTDGEDFAYDEATWNGVTAAPSKNVVRDLIEDDIRVNYATLNDPTFTGTPETPTAVSTTNNTQIASTGFVWDVVAPLIDYAADPTLPRVANLNTIADNSTKIPNTKWVQDLLADKLLDIRILDASFNQSLSPSTTGTGTATYRAYVADDFDSNSWIFAEIGGNNYLFYWAKLLFRPDSEVLFTNTNYYVAKLPISAEFQKSTNGNLIYQNFNVAIDTMESVTVSDEIQMTATAYWPNTKPYYYGLNDFVAFIRCGTSPGTSFLRANVFLVCGDVIAI